MADNIRFRMRRATDVWSVRERLALASSVMRSGDQNWVSVSRAVRPFGAPNRPPDWFSQKNCAMQYAELLEKVEAPRRKRGEKEVVETPGDLIVRKLTIARIEELKKIISDEREKYRALKAELELVQSGKMDGQMKEMWEKLQSEKARKAEEEAKRLADETAKREAAKAAAAPIKIKRPFPHGSNLESPMATVTKATLEADESTQDSSMYDSSLPLDSYTEDDGESDSAATAAGVGNSVRATPSPASRVQLSSQYSTSSIATSDISEIKQEPTANENTDMSTSDHVTSSIGQSVKEEGVASEVKAEDGHDYKDVSSLMSSPVKTEMVTPVPGSATKGTAAPTKSPSSTSIKHVMAVSSQAPTAVSTTEDQEVYPNFDFVNVVEVENEPDILILASPGGGEEEVVTGGEISPPGDEISPPSGGNVAVSVEDDVEDETALRGASAAQTFPTTSSMEISAAGLEQDVRDTAEVEEEVVFKTSSTTTSTKKKNEKEDLSLSVNESERFGEELKLEVDGSTRHEDTATSTATKASETSMTSLLECGAASPASSVMSTETVESMSHGKLSKSLLKGGSSSSTRSGRPARRKSSSRLSIESKDADIGSKPSEAETSEDDDSSVVSQSRRRRLETGDSLPNSPASISHSDTEEEKQHKIWKKAIMLVWRDVANHKYANTFLHAVTEDIAPGYKNVILRPMDLMTIKKNIDMGVIRSTVEFQRDMMLVFTNAIMYNSVGHDVHRRARDMYRDVMNLIEQFVSTQMMVHTEPKSLRGALRRSDAALASGSDKEEEPKKRRNSEIDTPTSAAAAASAASVSSNASSYSSSGEPRSKKRR